ncbi:IS3 family transposase [Nocardiopsis akebiae]|uniref:IS3 family transposase n=1 Tax=Nocardiopsis akebiae TaxID=2831968 RepID=A0ABX8BXY6_9ACTN|nr:IS3 family transposase [Nocardiopsis akebiae]QUX26951.1 IS3 family transposase [Nocardiopsis akebiae]
MQVELLDRRRRRTRLESANAIFEYLEIFHNRQRRHSAIGWLTPVEFENKKPSTVAWESRNTAPPDSGHANSAIGSG